MDTTARPPGGRLNGWKEIATHFGRAVRTVQRWERELGLPVHRLATGKGETVYALVDELDAWLAANERAASASPDPTGLPPDPAGLPPDPAPPPPPSSEVLRRKLRPAAWWMLAGALLLLVAAGVLVTRTTGWIGAGGRRVPSTHRRVGRVLTVFDQAGEVMWHRTMPFELSETRYANDAGLANPVIFEDLDGDGRTEVLFKAIGTNAADSGLLAFEEDGEPRFTWGYAGTKRFGDTSYPPPWAVKDAIVRRPAGGAPEIWVVVIDVPWFPSALIRLDARGRMTGEFWNPGNISFLTVARLGGREVLLAGGANNETKCAFVAVVDPAVSSTAPAVRDYFTCRDCPAARPPRYLLFPPTTLARELDAQGWVAEITQDAAGRVFVAVQHLGFTPPGQAEPMTAEVYYTLGDGLEPVSAELSGFYTRSYRRLERDGLITRPYEKALAERELWPIREWNGPEFVPLPVPAR